MANVIFNLSYSFEKQHGFVLRITERGKTNGSRVTVKGLTDPNFARWDKKEQRFIDPTEKAIHNNKVLKELKERYQYFIDNGSPQTPTELKHMVETGVMVGTSKLLTFGDFLKRTIESMKQANNKKPSKNYQNYINLFHKLEKEGSIINTPLFDINNSHFKAFGRFVLSLSDNEGKTNYINHMKRFKAIHKQAYQNDLNVNLLTYAYAEDAPTVETEKRIALTEKQYKRFVQLDLSFIPQSGRNREYFKELYHDFCIFLYEMKMRPVDVLRLHSSNIVDVSVGERKVECVRYIPEKKKNYKKDNIVYNKLTANAKAIISKYKGKSAQNYIFPFSMNEYDWDFNSPVDWGKWNNRKQATLEKIRAFLKKTAKFLGVNENDFILYTFRYSAITHEISQNKKAPEIIAFEAGTSIKMIDKNYLNYFVTL